jgi:hypothetical protein
MKKYQNFQYLFQKVGHSKIFFDDPQNFFGVLTFFFKLFFELGMIFSEILILHLHII